MNSEDCAKTWCLLLKTEGCGNTGSSPWGQLVRAVCAVSSSGGRTRTHHSLLSEILATVLPQVVGATLGKSASLESFFKQQSFHLWRRFAHIGKEYFFHAFFFKVSVALLFILENYASDVHAVKRKIPPLLQSRRDSRSLPHLPHLFPQHSDF